MGSERTFNEEFSYVGPIGADNACHMAWEHMIAIPKAYKRDMISLDSHNERARGLAHEEQTHVFYSAQLAVKEDGLPHIQTRSVASEACHAESACAKFPEYSAGSRDEDKSQSRIEWVLGKSAENHVGWKPWGNVLAYNWMD